MHIRKKFILITALVLALVLLTGCTQNENTAEKDYSAAILLLQEGKHTEAAEAFKNVGNYMDASKYALYCRALELAESGNYSEASDTMKILGDFMDSSIRSIYYAGRAYDEAGLYTSALEQYSTILQFEDAAVLAGAIPGKIQEAAYKAACELEKEDGKEQAAITAFKKLKGYKDSNERIAKLEEKIKAAEYARAEALEAKGSLEDARQVFLDLGTYSDSEARAAAILETILGNQFATAQAKEAADDIIGAYDLYVELGDYPGAAERAQAIREEALYRKAMNMANDGEYASARQQYSQLKDYKDSAEKARLLGVFDYAEADRVLNDGVFGFKLLDVWGYVDLINNRDVAPEYSAIRSFSSETGLAVFFLDKEQACLINRAGQKVLNKTYIDIREGEKGYYTGVTYGKSNTYYFDLISPEGTVLSTWLALGDSGNTNPGKKGNEYNLRSITFTSRRIIAQSLSGTYSLLNDKGEALLEDAAWMSFISRKAANDTVVSQYSKKGYGFFTLDGEAMDDHWWSDYKEFTGGYAAVCSKDGWGYISRDDCHIVIEPQYKNANSFSEGLAAVQVNGLWGFIDAKNQMIIEPQYKAVSAFQNKRCLVLKDILGYQVIDSTGKLLYFRQNAYLQADSQDQQELYEQAIAGFEALDGYADSSERAVQSREKINASVYAQAVKLEQEGRYVEAAETFSWLGDYKDASERAQAALEKFNAETYAQAAALEAAGKLEEAIEIYLTLGNYNESTQHAADLRESINQGICADADKLESEEKYEEAIVTLQQIPDYKGVTEHIAALQEKILQRDYNAAAALEDKEKFEEAIEAFTALGEYSDSPARITVLQEKILKREYDKAAALEDKEKFEEAIEAFTALGEYSDSPARITVLQEKILKREYDKAAVMEENEDYAGAYEAFLNLGGYSDSADRAISVAEKAEEQKRQKNYAAANEAEINGRLEEAVEMFAELGDYSDAKDRIVAIKEKITERDYRNALSLLEEGSYDKAVTAFTALGNYQDSPQRLAEAKNGAQYQQALADALNGNLESAYKAFSALGEYSDSAKKAEICGNLSRAGETQEITEGVLIYEFHGLWGLANLKENVLIPVKYTSMTFKQDTAYHNLNLILLRIKTSDGYDVYGYLNLLGQEIVPCKYIDVSDFDSEGRCTIATGHIMRDTYYTYSEYYFNRIYFGVMDCSGKVLIEPNWRVLGNSSNTSSYGGTRWNEDYYSKSWHDVYHTTAIPSFSDGKIMVQDTTENGLWGYVDLNGKPIGAGIVWTSIGDYSDGMAMVRDSKYLYGFIDPNGNQIGDVCWDQVNAFSYGLAAVNQNGYWGFINKKNELVIPCQYIEVSSFNEDGTCDVKTKDGTWQIIDQNGNVSFF